MIKDVLRLIRIKTIIFTAFTMCVMRYFLIFPLFRQNGFGLQMGESDFLLLVVSVCCLLSAAYVINDYFDTKIDRLAGSKTVIVGKTITRRTAIILHSLFNLLAVLLSFYLGFKVGAPWLGLLFFVISIILWCYSSRYKKRYVWGNLLVALLASFIPYMVMLFEQPLMTTNAGTGELILDVYAWISDLSVFLFFNMWIYEINKDLYSLQGDRDEGIMTFPVRLGSSKSRMIILVLIALVLIFLVWVYLSKFYLYRPILYYGILALLIPYILYAWLLYRGRSRKLQLWLIRFLLIAGTATYLFFPDFLSSI